MPAEPRVLVVGEALVDVVEGRATPGGSPANVAIGLNRLDVPAELTARFGTDVYGVLLAEHLAGNGVRLSSGTVDPTFRTSSATATLDEAGVASYAFDIDWRPPPLRLPAGAAAVHTGSIATVLAPGAEAVREFVRSLAGAPVTVSLDPNARPTVTPDAAQAWAAVTDLAGHADLVKLSDEDCAFLQPGVPAEQVATRLLTADRTRLVVITLGGDGALGVTADGPVRVPAPQVEVVDTVGAGDSFMSALIAALHTRSQLGPTRLATLDPAALHDTLTYAVQAAAITCTRPGADPPTTADLTPTPI